MKILPSPLNQIVNASDTNAAVDAIIAGSQIAVSGATGTVTVSANAATVAALNNSPSIIATTGYADRNFYLPTVAGFRDDFLSSAGATTITAATLFSGETTWATTVVGSGTSTQSPADGTVANPGQVLLTTSAAGTGQGIVVYKSNHGPLGNLGGNAGWDFHAVIQLGSNTNVALRVGLVSTGSHASDAPTNGIWVQFDTANTASAANLTYTTAASSVYNYSNVNAVNADTNFHHIRIRSLVAGTILFSTDGGTETPIAVAITTNALCPFVQLISRTTGAKTANLDFISYASQTTRT